MSRPMSRRVIISHEGCLRSEKMQTSQFINFVSENILNEKLSHILVKYDNNVILQVTDVGQE